jgi:hypothetical protein
MDRLQEAENDYIRLIQQSTLKLNISPSEIPTTEEIQAAVEGIMSFYFMMFSLLAGLVYCLDSFCLITRLQQCFLRL